MRDGDEIEIIAFVGGIFFGVCLFMGILIMCGFTPGDIKEGVHRDAVKAGVAEYVVGEDGEPVFQWRKID